MGVWIETVNRNVTYQDNQVTPCMGVWIETSPLCSVLYASKRHTLYGCVD